MSDVVIRAEGLGKSYLIGHESERERYVALRDVIARGARNLVRTVGNVVRGRQLVVGGQIEEFWALKDVNFEIRRGDVVGIIGRNGAGKSTLLKILSRITEPTAGRVEIRGRVASLLEVGTGFHPELTGRENIFLNGAILGMTRAEIRRKFDEIVAFAEIERFLDTPVKRYSSGMYVRLAFAVAAHLEPEILIVDEVLAVGDVEFQKKCLGKMQDVASGGRTVLFVSHNMGAVQALCPVSILLRHGRLVSQDATTEVVRSYLQARDANAMGFGMVAKAGQAISVEDVRVSPDVPVTASDIEISVSLKASVETRIREAAILIYGSNGVRVAIIDLRKDGLLPLKIPKGVTTLDAAIREVPLVEGSYSIGLYIVSDQFEGNLLDLKTLQLMAPAQKGAVVGYPAMARGLVELAYQARVGARTR